jgi:hypothetical protein
MKSLTTTTRPTRRVIATVTQKVKERDAQGVERTRIVTLEFFSATEYRQHLQQTALQKSPPRGLKMLRGRGTRTLLAQTMRNQRINDQHTNIEIAAEFRAAFDKAQGTSPKLSSRRQARKWVRGEGITRLAHIKLLAADAAEQPIATAA